MAMGENWRTRSNLYEMNKKSPTGNGEWNLSKVSVIMDQNPPLRAGDVRRGGTLL
jgi:hypothetical protein